MTDDRRFRITPNDIDPRSPFALVDDTDTIQRVGDAEQILCDLAWSLGADVVELTNGSTVRLEFNE